jgi:hypothetical protein
MYAHRLFGDTVIGPPQWAGSMMKFGKTASQSGLAMLAPTQAVGNACG